MTQFLVVLSIVLLSALFIALFYKDGDSQEYDHIPSEYGFTNFHVTPFQYFMQNGTNQRKARKQ
jgi:glucan phosphoethanolaminetransferase (alkaline phosphatase superfamily)